MWYISSVIPVEAKRYVMAHAQKPHFIFRRNGWDHLNRRGRQFSRLLAAKVCASAVVMLVTPCSEVVWKVLTTHYIRQFPFTSPPVLHRVPSHSERSIPHLNFIIKNLCDVRITSDWKKNPLSCAIQFTSEYTDTLTDRITLNFRQFNPSRKECIKHVTCLVT